MAYYQDLAEYIAALEREGLLFLVSRPVNKDTEMHPLVRCQFRGLGEDPRRAFLFEKVHDSKGERYDMPLLIGGLAASQRIYALGLMCKESEGEELWSRALERPIPRFLSGKGHRNSCLYVQRGLRLIPQLEAPGLQYRGSKTGTGSSATSRTPSG
ncbi:MAG TPA: hypothetical protein VNN77_07235 [candidate division Zixibacteria bacterium]|nr:hypothetical protein [candidate division Zixibacteria bacterium]